MPSFPVASLRLLAASSSSASSSSSVSAFAACRHGQTKLHRHSRRSSSSSSASSSSPSSPSGSSPSSSFSTLDAASLRLSTSSLALISRPSRCSLLSSSSSCSSSSSSSPSSSLRRGFATETSEEKAKRLSDELDAELAASGRQKNIRDPKLRAAQRAQSSSSPSSSSSSSTASASPASASPASPSSSDASASSSASSDSASSASPSSSNTDSSSSSSPSSSSSSTSTSFFRTLSAELKNAREFIGKFQRPKFEKKKRNLREVLEKEKPFEGAPPVPPLPPSEEEIHATSSSDPSSPLSSSTSSSSLILVDSSTVWDKRLERMRTSFSSSSPFLTYRKARRTLIHSQNPILKPLHDLSSALSAQIDDVKLTWETSQHPTLFKVRNVTERIIGENEQGFALGEMMKIDPSFDVLSFIDEMEHYMIPAVVTAYRRGTGRDLAMLKGMSEGMAASKFRTSFAARAVDNSQWDSAILDVSGVELANTFMVQDEPILQLEFMVQHIKCVRKYKTKAALAAQLDPVISEGSESAIISMRYVWQLRRDFTNPDFDWKLLDFITSEVSMLTA